MARAHVPKFGNWESGSNVPYTQYFDNARKGRTGGKLINPNDPQENPEAFSVESSPSHGLQFGSGSGPEAAEIMHDRRSSREDGNLGRPISHIPHYAATHKLSSESPYRKYGNQVNSDEPQTQKSRISVGSDHSFELSPLHPSYRSKSTSTSGVSSPSWEKRSSSEGHGHGRNTLERSRMKPSGRTDDNLKKGSTVPKFGEWDESNPASADGYTQIFNVIREEKQIGSAKVHVANNHSSYPNGHKRTNSEDSVTCWCFRI